MKKIMLCLLVAVFAVGTLAGCGTGGEQAPVRITAITGPTGVGLVPLMEHADNGQTENDYRFSVVSDPSQTVAAVVAGDTDIAAVPTNLAATLYQKTNGNVQVLAVNTLGVLYLMENGDTVHSVTDLKGKTVYTAGQGATPEYALRYLLEKNGLDPDKDVTVRFVDDNDALVTLLVSGKASIAVVPEPKVTACRMQNAALRVALDLTEQWEAVSDGNSQLMMGCVVARRDFIEKNKAVVETFLREYAGSVKTAVEDVDKTAGLCVRYGVIPKEPIAKAAIPNCRLVCLTGAGMKTQLMGYLSVLYDHNPAAVGGEKPPEDLCYEG